LLIEPQAADNPFEALAKDLNVAGEQLDLTSGLRVELTTYHPDVEPQNLQTAFGAQSA